MLYMNIQYDSDIENILMIKASFCYDNSFVIIYLVFNSSYLFLK